MFPLVSFTLELFTTKQQLTLHLYFSCKAGDNIFHPNIFVYLLYAVYACEYIWWGDDYECESECLWK